MAHGGKRPGAGRKPGTVTAAKRSLAQMAMQHASKAMETLADVASRGDSASARVAAAVAILDRAYGKPPQWMGEDGDEAPALTITIGVRDAVGDVRITKPE